MLTISCVMSAIRTNAAAAMLGVSPNTLRGWERRFGYPMPHRTEGGHRQFELTEIEALRQAFAETHDIASAVSVARERGEGPSSPARLQAALEAFAPDAADRLLEESLAVRSVERTVESVLLAALELLREELGRARVRLRYTTGWLAAATRVAPPASREEGALIFDASHPASLDAPHVQALELFLRRGGLRVLTLPVELDAGRVGAALRALRPGAIVLAGCGGVGRHAGPARLRLPPGRAGRRRVRLPLRPARDGSLDRQAHRPGPHRRGRAAARAAHRRGAGASRGRRLLSSCSTTATENAAPREDSPRRGL